MIVEVTDKEAKLIKILRQVKWGKVVVYKEDGEIVRVEQTETVKV